MSLLANSLRRSFIQMSVPAKLLLLLLLMFFLMVFGSLVSILLAVSFYNSDIKALVDSIGNPDSGNINLIKYFQITQSLFLFILPALIAAWLFSESTFHYLKADRKASAFTLFMVLLSIVVSVPLMNAMTIWNLKLDLPVWLDGVEEKIKNMEENAGRLTKLFLAGDSYVDLAVNFLMIGILPALGEEFLFRGILQKLLAEWTKNNHIGVILTAFLFSFIHFQFYGFIPRFLLGLYFGYLLIWSSSIWVPVTAHLINNGMAVIYYHFTKDPMGDTVMDKIGTTPEGNYALYLSVFLTSIFIGLLYLHEKHKNSSAV